MAHQSTKARAFVTSMTPESEIDIKDPEPVEEVDEDMPQSLEEALLGE